MASDSDRLRTSDLAASEPRRNDAPSQDRATEGGGAAEGTSASVREEPLLPVDDLEGFRERWDSIQTYFVDSPRQAVTDADALVAEVMQRIADTFARERSQLEGQWEGGDEVSTEDLRVVLQRYRSFFNRLIHM